MLSRRVIAAGLILTQLALSCSSDDRTATPPTTVAGADVIEPVLNPDLRVGMVLNISAPTAERDRQVSEVLLNAVRASPAAGLAQIEIVQIDEPEDVESAVVALRGLGATVLITTCDDGTVPDVIASGLANEMLVLTGCSSLPLPAIDSDSDLVIDLAGLASSPAAIAAALDEVVELQDPEGERQIATLTSDLIPGVSNECERTSLQAGLEVTVEERFTELVDDPEEFITSVSPQLEDIDAIILCALAPSAGEVVSALRQNGFDQPVVVPWFADDQTWAGDHSDVWIVAPSSRYGDDPVEEVNALYSQSEAATATDIVVADTLTTLVDAVQRAGSIRPAQMAEVLRTEPFEGLSGELTLNQQGDVERAYRLLEVVDGEPQFSRTLEP